MEVEYLSMERNARLGTVMKDGSRTILHRYLGRSIQVNKSNNTHRSWLPMFKKKLFILAYVAKLKKELSRRPSILKFDCARKRQRQYNIFEAIKKTQKKREDSTKSKSKYSLSLSLFVGQFCIKNNFTCSQYCSSS